MKRIYQVIMVFLVFMYVAKESNSQNVTPYLFPADHYLISNSVSNDEALFNSYMLYEDNLKAFITQIKQQSFDSRTDTLINGKRIIPIVFHIIHKGGVENISDAQILDAIERINIDYNLQNADTADTYPLFKSRAADCQVEFRLAKVDPWGNCTDGVNRIYDPMTNYAYFSTMSKYAWSPSRYMNVFVVNFIYPEGMSLPDGAFIGGMSPFPPSNPLTQALTGGDTLADGILIRHDAIGAIGTAQTMGGMPINSLNRTFTHESGHYFNLYHPFQNLMFGMLPAASGCHSMLAPNGDYVDDTPQAATANQNTSLSCIVPGSVNSCTNDPEPDMVENYMDYQFGYCTNIFTLGQYERMEATLMGDRRKLWSYENLLYTGVLDTVTQMCAPRSDFYADKKMVCSGGVVEFYDYSWSGQADSYYWTFDGGTPSTSTDQNPSITYNTPGVYSVSLKVSNFSGEDSLVKQSFIRVFDASIATTTPYTESFETISLNNFIIQNDTGSTWQITNSAGYTGSKSLQMTNFEGNMAGSYTEIITPSYDFSSFSTNPPPSLKFRLAYSGKAVAASMLMPADTIYDMLTVYVSKDCGATWVQRFQKKGSALATTTPIDVEFIPFAQGQWRQESILLTGGYAGQENVRFKFEFYSNGGNNLFIDDLYIDEINASIEDLESQYNVSLYPNPANNETVISLNLYNPEIVVVNIYDLTGRMVYSLNAGLLNAGTSNITLDLSSINASGLYFANIRIGANQITKNLSIVK